MLFDHSTGLYYYFFGRTSESRWSLSPWRCVLDEATGCCYYENEVTAESKWELEARDVPEAA